MDYSVQEHGLLCYPAVFRPRLSPPSGRGRLRLTFGVGHRVQGDLSRMIAGVVGMPFTPVIADRIGEDTAVEVKGGGGDAVSDGRERLEPMVGVFVPETVGAIGAGSAEGVVARMEGYGIDRIDQLGFGVVVFEAALTSEGEV